MSDNSRGIKLAKNPPPAAAPQSHRKHNRAQGQASGSLLSDSVWLSPGYMWSTVSRCSPKTVGEGGYQGSL